MCSTTKQNLLWNRTSIFKVVTFAEKNFRSKRFFFHKLDRLRRTRFWGLEKRLEPLNPPNHEITFWDFRKMVIFQIFEKTHFFFKNEFYAFLTKRLGERRRPAYTTQGGVHSFFTCFRVVFCSFSVVVTKSRVFCTPNSTDTLKKKRWKKSGPRVVSTLLLFLLWPTLSRLLLLSHKQTNSYAVQKCHWS